MEASPIITCFSICFLFHFRSVLCYSLPGYFVNCGSASTVSINGQEYSGDVNPVESVRVPSLTGTRTDQNSSAPELYRTARLFARDSSYEFKIEEEGIYVVRFHFFPLSSLGKLSDARFSVLASGISLLSNFTAGNKNYSSSPPIEEFLLRIPPGEFEVRFVPSGQGLFAFVNAIEVFLAPPELIPEGLGRPDPVTPGSEKSYNDLRSNIIRVIHRINVGGQHVMPYNDTLLRYWIPDDDVGFMLNKDAAKNSEPYSGQLNYNSGGSTKYIAPDNVYRTAKEMNIRGDGLIRNFNVSWRFGVRRGAEHLIRLHFCDVVTPTTNELVRFNLYIYGNERETWPYKHGNQPASPFYVDYLAKSDDSGFMNISIGPSNNSDEPTAAPFLNGVEIMELIGDTSGLRAGGAGSTRNWLPIIVGSGVGGGILVIVLVTLAVCCIVSRKKKWKPIEAFERPLILLQGGSSYSRTTVRTVSDSPTPDLNLGLRIPFTEILHATKKFDPELMIGRGGFGTVYRGMLWNGMKVAVKRSQSGHGQGLSEFQTEIVILSRIRHRHLVSLIGYCDERGEMILVYEFMEKGTLRDHLYSSEGGESQDPTSASKLWWDERLQICIDAAKGLHYLHTGAAGAIIHRDIKSTNILLDEHKVAKVADFGLSHSALADESHVCTEVKGTFGYLDPEYFRFSQLTQKSDVYSFGVVLLEILCARPALNQALPRDQVNLAEWGKASITNGLLDKIIDPFLAGKINPNCLRKFGDTVEKCLQECGADRPNMVDVLWDLEYCLRLQHTATPTAGAVYDDTTTTDVALGLPVPVVMQRYPSDSIGEDELPPMRMIGRLPSDTIDEAELPQDSGVFSEASKVDAEEVFSQLKVGKAR